MTTHSETRAGKLPELPSTTRKYGLVRLYTAEEMRAYALEALAASEPVEVIAVDTQLGVRLMTLMVNQGCSSKARMHVCTLSGMAQHPERIHPRDAAEAIAYFTAPEQPGNGEALTERQRRAVVAAMQNAEHDAGDFDDADEDQSNARDLYEGLQKLLVEPQPWEPTPCPECGGFCGDTGPGCNPEAAPQPSDPAEGDAHEKLADILYSIGWQPSNDAQLNNLRKAMPDIAALSTPQTAAVSVDDGMVDRFIEAFHNGPIGDSYRSQLRAALTAALDPQVKR